MALSQNQFMSIINSYDQVRRNNHMEEQRRKEEVYASIPEIRHIDEKIAHISVEKAKKMIFDKNADERESLKSEIYDLYMEKINLLVIHHYPADYLDPIYCCDKCKDTGYVGTEKCHCFQQQILDILYDQSNLRELIEKENFSTFQLDYYSGRRTIDHPESPRENMVRILDRSHLFIDTFDQRPGGNLLIYGNAGVGKTFLTNCIACELLKKGKSVIYQTAYQFFDQLADYTFRREK